MENNVYTFTYDTKNELDRRLLKDVYAIAKVEGYIEVDDAQSIQDGCLEVIDIMWDFLYRLATRMTSPFHEVIEDNSPEPKVEPKEEQDEDTSYLERIGAIDEKSTLTEIRLSKVARAERIIEEFDKDSSILDNICISVSIEIDDREQFLTNGGYDDEDTELNNDNRDMIEECIDKYFDTGMYER